MADESSVYITGSEPDWAIEKALDGILAELRKTQKVTKEQEKILKRSTSGGKMFDKQAWKELTSSLKKATKQGFEQGRANTNLIQSTKQLSKEFKESSKIFKGAMVGAGLVGGLFGALYENFKATIGMFEKLTDVGLSVNMHYRDMARSLAETGMSLKRFEDLALKYSTVMGKMGPTQFLETVSEIGDGFNKFGLTMAQGAEWAAEYLERQRMLGNYSIYSQQGLNEAVRSNVERLTAYSKILNVSRSELQAAQMSAAQDDLVQMRLMTRSREEATAMGDALADTVAILQAFQAPELGQDFTRMFGFDEIMMSQDFQEYFGTTAAEFTNALAALHDKTSAGIQEGLQADIENLGRLASEYIDENGYILSMAEGDLTAQQRAMKNLARGYEQWIDMSEEQRDAALNRSRQVNSIVEQTTRLDQNVESLRLSFLYLTNEVLEKLIGIFGAGGTEEAAEAGIAGLANAAGRAAQFLRDLADDKIEWGGIFATIGSAIWDGIKDGFTWVMTSIGMMITNAVDRVAEAIRNWSPFGNDQSMEYTEAMQSSASGRAYINLNENAAELAEAEARLERLTTGPRGGNRNLGEDIADTRALVEELQENNRRLLAIYRQSQLTTEAIEDTGG